MTIQKLPWQHHAKVICICGNKVEVVFNDKPYPLCFQYVKDHKNDTNYVGCTLKVVSVYEKNYSQY